MSIKQFFFQINLLKKDSTKKIKTNLFFRWQNELARDELEQYGNEAGCGDADLGQHVGIVPNRAQQIERARPRLLILEKVLSRIESQTSQRHI